MEGDEGSLKMGLKKSEQDSGADVVDEEDEDFFVDELLDFSKECLEEGEEDKQEIGLEKPAGAGAVAAADLSDRHAQKDVEKPAAFSDQPAQNAFLTVPGGDGLNSGSCEEFNVPAGVLEELEWLSQFVEDSFSGYSLTYPTGKLPLPPAANRVTDENETQLLAIDEKPCFKALSQTKSRSKRAKNGGRVLSIGSGGGGGGGSLTESSTNSSTSSSSTYSSPNSNPCLIYVPPSHKHNQTAESLMVRPLTKKHKKKKPETIVSSIATGCGSQPVRRCSHCLVQKTPQWRAGPLGAKTLCNACGVRYKSGRLLPEYRPACSPTFSTEIHSNNHRKVLEMRRKKEMNEPPVQSF